MSSKYEKLLQIDFCTQKARAKKANEQNVIDTLNRETLLEKDPQKQKLLAFRLEKLLEKKRKNEETEERWQAFRKRTSAELQDKKKRARLAWLRVPWKKRIGTR